MAMMMLMVIIKHSFYCDCDYDDGNGDDYDDGNGADKSNDDCDASND